MALHDDVLAAHSAQLADHGDRLDKLEAGHGTGGRHGRRRHGPRQLIAVARWDVPPSPYPDAPPGTKARQLDGPVAPPSRDRPPSKPKRRKSPGDPACDRCLSSEHGCCPEHRAFYAETLDGAVARDYLDRLDELERRSMNLELLDAYEAALGVRLGGVDHRPGRLP